MPVQNEPLADDVSVAITSFPPTLTPDSYDTIVVSYPSAAAEVYTFSYLGATQATVTVTFSDSTKESLTSVVRS